MSKEPRVHQVNGWWYIEGQEMLEFHSMAEAERWLALHRTLVRVKENTK